MLTNAMRYCSLDIFDNDHLDLHSTWKGKRYAP